MSTSRYTNAGLPGNGQTLHNMYSRMIAWGRWDYAGGTPSGYQLLGISSLLDEGVGVTRAIMVASTTGAPSGTGIAYCWHSYVIQNANGPTLVTYDGAPGAPAPVAQDAPGSVVHVMGILA